MEKTQKGVGGNSSIHQSVYGEHVSIHLSFALFTEVGKLEIPPQNQWTGGNDVLQQKKGHLLFVEGHPFQL